MCKVSVEMNSRTTECKSGSPAVRQTRVAPPPAVGGDGGEREFVNQDFRSWEGLLNGGLAVLLEDLSAVQGRKEEAGPLRLRSGQAFDSAEVRFAQDDSAFKIMGFVKNNRRSFDSAALRSR